MCLLIPLGLTTYFLHGSSFFYLNPQWLPHKPAPPSLLSWSPLLPLLSHCLLPLFSPSQPESTEQGHPWKRWGLTPGSPTASAAATANTLLLSSASHRLPSSPWLLEKGDLRHRNMGGLTRVFFWAWGKKGTLLNMTFHTVCAHLKIYFTCFILKLV